MIIEWLYMDREFFADEYWQVLLFFRSEAFTKKIIHYKWKTFFSGKTSYFHNSHSNKLFPKLCLFFFY